MFQTASGVMVPFPEKIKEEFQIYETSILLNISFEKLQLFINKFIAQLPEPLFFVLELPLPEQEESKLRTTDSCPFHKNVCFLDGQSTVWDTFSQDAPGEVQRIEIDGKTIFDVYDQLVQNGMYVAKVVAD